LDIDRAGEAARFVQMARTYRCEALTQAVLWQILRPFGALRQVRKRRGLRASPGRSGDVGHAPPAPLWI